MVHRKRGKTVNKHIQMPITKNSFVICSKENKIFNFKLGDIAKVITVSMFVLLEKDGLQQIVPRGCFKPC